MSREFWAAAGRGTDSAGGLDGSRPREANLRLSVDYVVGVLLLDGFVFGL